MMYLVLPAYNEEKDLGQLLQRVSAAMDAHKINYRVLLVNDGSVDNTLALAQEMAGSLPMELIDHGFNRGLGQALLSGLRRAHYLADDDDVVVTMDADNTHDPALIGAMMAQIDAGYDLVIASRYAPGGEEVGLSWSRRVFSAAASRLLRLFFPVPGVKDYTCGYRAYRGELLRRAFTAYGDALVQERGFTCMAEVLIKMGRLGARVGEVPLVLRYDFKSGPSKMKVARTIWRYGVLITSNLFAPLPRR